MIAAALRADRRVQRTRATLRRAFDELLIQAGYDAITPTEIAERAGVGRSTFYEHYRGKEEMLRDSLVSILSPLADCVDNPDLPPRLHLTLEHIRSSRGMARTLLSGRARVVVSKSLQDLIEVRLRQPQNAGTILPAALAAAHIAGGMLSLIEAWLTARESCSVTAMTRAFHATSLAVSTSIQEQAHGDAAASAAPAP